MVLALGMTVQDRPWMRCDPEGGHPCPEKSCALPHEVARLKAENPDRIILACECQHECNPDDPHADETGGRTWDARCQARCRPTNCTCPHVCGS